MPLQEEISKQFNQATGNYLVIYLSILQFTEITCGQYMMAHVLAITLQLKETWNLMIKTFFAGN